jgi:hypothetical protein
MLPLEKNLSPSHPFLLFTVYLSTIRLDVIPISFLSSKLPFSSYMKIIT